MGGESQRYAALQPPDIGSNLFSYHLKALKESGYVIRTGFGTYGLSAAGKRYADGLSLQDLKPRVQPKIVIFLACRDRLGRWLLMKRRIQPLLDQIGFPYGKLHLGETIAEAAKRELAEKTGLDGELTHRGDGYLTIREDGKAVSEVFFHLFYGIAPTGYLKSEHKAGEVFWGGLDTDFTQPPYMASMPDLIEALESTPPDQRFFIERIYDSKDSNSA